MSSRWLTNDEVTSATDPALASKVKQCYNNITVNTNNITLENTDSGVSKTVAVSGGSSSSTIAYNSVSVSGNDIVFGKTDGSTADTQPLGGLTAITDLQTLTTGHTTSIDDLEAREQFKTVTQHPDLTAAQIDSLNNPYTPLTVNGRTWHFAHSSSEASVAQSVHSAFSSNSTRRWESLSTNANYVYNSLVSGSYYDYSGSNSVGGTLGEWIRIQLPEAVILSSFTISADSEEVV